MRVLAIFLLSLTGLLSAWGQDALPIHVQFTFGTTAVNSRFRAVSKQVLEPQITAILAAACSKALPPWQCDSEQAPTPKIDVSVQVRDDKWYLKVLLTPQPNSPDLKSEWKEQQIFTGEQLIANGGLPMDDGWIAPIQAAFEQVLDQKAKTGKELFESLKQIAPLGKNVVPVPLDTQHPLPGAVLPLLWDRYQRMASCHVRIYYRGKNGELISIVSSGSGPMDFTPETRQYKGVWVLHQTYQVGGGPTESITKHIQELSDLTVLEFHLEDPGTIPPGLNLAP